MKHAKVHLGLEYLADPIWAPGPDGGLGPIPPSELPISKPLSEDLLRWAADFDAEFERGGDEFDERSPAAKELRNRGLQLWQRMVDEIGHLVEVHYDSPIEGQSFRVHRPKRKDP